MNPIILSCCEALAASCTIEIPAFNTFQTARRGTPPGNIILARGSVLEPVSRSHGSWCRVEGQQYVSTASDSALGMVSYTWVWCLGWFGPSAKEMFNMKHASMHMALMGPLLCLKFSVSATTWRNEAVSFNFTRMSVKASAKPASSREVWVQTALPVTYCSIFNKLLPPSPVRVCERSIIEIHTLTLGKEHPQRVTSLFSWGHCHSKSDDLIARVLTN